MFGIALKSDPNMVPTPVFISESRVVWVPAITEVDVREVHDNPDSSKLIDVANQLAKETTTMDSFRLGINRT